MIYKKKKKKKIKIMNHSQKSRFYLLATLPCVDIVFINHFGHCVKYLCLRFTEVIFCSACSAEITVFGQYS